jgi:hypothetical protein
MAEQPPNFQFEDVPLDEARRMGRGPRMEPMLYDTLRQKIQSLSSEATRIHLVPEIRPERMKNYLLRKVFQSCGSGILCWRTSATNFVWGYRDDASAALSLLPRECYCATWHDP